MKAIGQSSVEFAVEEVLRVSLHEFRKSDTENDQRLIDLAVKYGDSQRELADARVECARLNAQVEMLSEDLQRERDHGVLMMTGTDGAPN